MKPFKALNKLGSLRNISTAGSILAPILDNRMVPYPYMMIWVITRRCNAKCQMCTIWQEKKSPYLSLEQAGHILSKDDYSFVRSLTLTGGEPTLRADLPDLFDLALDNMPNLEHVLLATSGLNTNRTIKYVEAMLENLSTRENKVYRFDVQVSLDGVDEVHDLIRGIDGFFGQVQATIRGLQALQPRFPKLNLRLSSVLMPHNVPFADNLARFAKESALPIHYSPVVIAGEYYNNMDGVNTLRFSEDDRRGMAVNFFENLSEEDNTSLRFYYKDMVNMIQGEDRGRRCMMGFYGFVLEHTGDIYPCVNCERVSFGNVLHKSFDQVWFGDGSDNVREQLRASCCPKCTSMCFPPPVNLIEVTKLAVRKRLNGREDKTVWVAG